MATKLRLHCDVLNGRFTLSRQGEDWRKSFDSFDDAYEFAESRATEPTPLVLYNERGRVILETLVYPPPEELVKFRHPLGGILERQR